MRVAVIRGIGHVGRQTYTIVRATQFYEVPGTVVDCMRQGDTVTIPPLLMRSVASSDVAEALAA
jgi:hypothetical protein